MYVVNSNHVKLIITGDDCVAINGGCKDINVTRIACGPGHGIRFVIKTLIFIYICFVFEFDLSLKLHFTIKIYASYLCAQCGKSRGQRSGYSGPSIRSELYFD